MKHPLHYTIGNEVNKRIKPPASVIRDKACGGKQHIPLFHGKDRSRKTQLCKVDLLVSKLNKVKVIIEIEESGFNPTKICGKYLTSALSTHYIHGEDTMGLSKEVLFVQVLDGSKVAKKYSSKPAQCELIEKQINTLAKNVGSSISKYQLLIVNGDSDLTGIKKVVDLVDNFV